MRRFLCVPLLVCLLACQSEEQRLQTLVQQLGDADVAHRTKASKALVAMGPKAVDALIQGVTDARPRIREMSVWTLSEIKAPAARIVPVLIRVLTDPDENIRVIGSVALQSFGEPAVPYLIAALTAEAADIRLNAAYVLGEIGTPVETIVPALIRTLTDPEWNVRRLVVRALATIGDPAIEPLTSALNAPDPDLRGMAARALNDIGTPRARQAIAAARRDGVDR